MPDRRDLPRSGSVMTARRSSATDLGATLVAALGEQDFGRLARTLAPDVRMRALIPPGPVELSRAEPVAAKFASWFGEGNGLELVRSGSDEVGDRLHVFYRLRVKRPGDAWKVIEQHLFCALDEGRITALDLVCSGFRPDAAGAPSKSVSGFLYEAASADAVRDAALRAALPFERVADAIAAERISGRAPRGDASVTPFPTANWRP
jgi:SnoaL-like domain